MRIGVSLLIIFSIITTSFSCSRKYEVYDFSSTEKEFPWGVVGSRLVGSEKNVNGVIIKNSPYRMLVWFKSKSIEEGGIQIAELNLKSIETGEILISKKNLTSNFSREGGGMTAAYFNFSNLSIPFHDMILTINFKIKQETTSGDYSTSIKLKKNFKKFKTIIGV